MANYFKDGLKEKCIYIIKVTHLKVNDNLLISQLALTSHATYIYHFSYYCIFTY